MAKHTNKILCGLLALSAGFVLASCDTINALPNGYEEPIVARVGEGEYSLTDNEMGKIWEAIVSGKAESIHSEIIYRIAVNQFGEFYGEGGVASITTDAEIKAFVEAHPSVFVRDEDATLAGSSDETVIFNTVRKPRFLAFRDDIKERIAEKLYGEITSGNFNDKEGRFSELKLVKDHYFSGDEIEGLDFDDDNIAKDTIKDSTEKWHKAYITSTIDKHDLDSIGTVLHLDKYTKYLEKKVIRDIYSEKLIEEFVFKNKYSTLGRAYARHASYVKLSYTNDNKTFAEKLLRYYADDVIVAGVGVEKDHTPNEEKVANTWRGIYNIEFDDNGKIVHSGCAEGYNGTGLIPGDAYGAAALGYTTSTVVDRLVAEKTIGGDPKYGANAAAVFTKLGADTEEQDVLSYPYIKESKVGEILERYFKACRAVMDGKEHIASSKDQSELDTFTGSNAHGRMKGLKDELSKLVLEDYTVDEWGLKNGGFSDLSSNARDRLFNINVANAVDGFTGDNAKYKEEGTTASEIGNYATSGIYSYVRYVNGFYYLNKADAQKYEDDNYSYIFDEDNSYVIVNIIDAANSTKLNVEHEKSYVHLKADPLFTENTAREIAKLLGTKESYKSDAYQHYLEKYNLSFSDQELYDYFVTTYPDLYGEDK